MATRGFSDIADQHLAHKTGVPSGIVLRHSVRLTELAEESRRLKRDFLKGSIQFSLTMVGLADSNQHSAVFRDSCRRAAQKGCARIRSMIAKAAFAQLDLSDLLPSLRELEIRLAETGNEDVLPIPFDRQALEPSPAQHPGLRALTPREMQVLGLIAEGNSTKEIAHVLGMSFKTAACHRYRVMDKLGIHDAVSLTRFAVRAGLVRL